MPSRPATLAIPVLLLTLVGPLLSGVPESQVVRQTHGSGVDFQIGRDNLAFNNPDGPLVVGRWRGNCFGMAAATKLLFENATFAGRATTAGMPVIDLVAVARRAAGAAGPRVEVQDYSNLFDMTNEAAFGEQRAMIEMWIEAVRGASAAGTTARSRERCIVRCRQLVAVIQYLVKIGPRIEICLDGVARSLAADAAAGVTARAVASMKAQLRAGRTAIASIHSAAGNSFLESPGHAVLAYRIEECDGYDDVFVYDSNIQHGAERAESLWRVERAGSHITLLRKQPGGPAEIDHVYDPLPWFGPLGSPVLLHHPDELFAGSGPGSLETLSRELTATTGYLLCGRRLVFRARRGLGTLRSSLRQYFVDVGAVQRGSGNTATRRTDPVPDESDTRGFNALIESQWRDVVGPALSTMLPIVQVGDGQGFGR